MIKAKTLRGKILQILRENTSGLDRDGIVYVFYQYYHIKEIDEALHYLKDKGYIEEHHIQLAPYRSYKIYKITAKGIDILDATEQDKGIALPGEAE